MSSLETHAGCSLGSGRKDTEAQWTMSPALPCCVRPRWAVHGVPTPLEGEGGVMGGRPASPQRASRRQHLTSRSKIPPTGATRCPWRPRVSTAGPRPRSTVWSSRRSPSGWSCAGGWTAGHCECWSQCPDPSGRVRAPSPARPRSTSLLPPPGALPPLPQLLSHPSAEALLRSPREGPRRVDPTRDLWQWLSHTDRPPQCRRCPG